MLSSPPSLGVSSVNVCINTSIFRSFITVMAIANPYGSFLNACFMLSSPRLGMSLFNICINTSIPSRLFMAFMASLNSVGLFSCVSSKCSLPNLSIRACGTSTSPIIGEVRSELGFLSGESSSSASPALLRMFSIVCST